MRCPSEVETRLQALPPLPPVAQRVLQVLTDEPPSTDALLDTLRDEPEMADAVVRMSNSSEHPLPRPIEDGSQAVAYLGERTIGRLTACLSLAPLWPKPDEAGWGRNVWRRAVLCGLGAELAAAASGMADPRPAFVAGLLADVGALVLGPLCESRAEAMREQLEQGRTQLEAEREILGVDHTGVGAWVVDRWHLPQTVRDAVRLHHNPERAGGLTCVTHVGDVLVTQLGFGAGPDGLARPTSGDAVTRLQLDSDRLDALRLLLLDERARSRELVRLPAVVAR